MACRQSETVRSVAVDADWHDIPEANDAERHRPLRPSDDGVLWLQGPDEVWAKPCEIVADKDRNILKEIYRWTNGDNWINSENWLTDAPLNEWHGVTADTADVVSGLELADNGLLGIVPLETGDLVHLRTLALGEELPERMLELAQLSKLRAEGTGLCLPGAKWFRDWLGRIADAEGGALRGRPRQRRRGRDRRRVRRTVRGQAGERGGRGLVPVRPCRSRDADLGIRRAKPLSSARSYDDRNELLGHDDGGSEIAARDQRRFRLLLTFRCLDATRIPGAATRQEFPRTPSPAVDAYLTQPVQPHDFGVPLVADEEALLRVFVTADSGVVASMPPVRATFYRGETETHSVLSDGSAQQVPWEMAEGDLDRTAKAVVPAGVVVPGTEDGGRGGSGRHAGFVGWGSGAGFRRKAAWRSTSAPCRPSTLRSCRSCKRRSPTRRGSRSLRTSRPSTNCSTRSREWLPASTRVASSCSRSGSR